MAEKFTTHEQLNKINRNRRYSASGERLNIIFCDGVTFPMEVIHTFARFIDKIFRPGKNCGRSANYRSNRCVRGLAGVKHSL